MKTLLLMRHGKSSWKQSNLPDQERPLTKRGAKAVQRMGELIERKELVPQLILTSPAVRARETARIFCEKCSCSDRIQTVDDLYLAEAETYLEHLRKLPGEIERVMLVGHNPGLESLLQILNGQIETLSTAVIAFVSLPIKTWEELNDQTEGELIELWRPKELIEEKPKSKKKKISEPKAGKRKKGSKSAKKK